MMMRGERGTAMAETALAVGLAVMIIFNAFELAEIGFFQIQADAEAFIGARVFAITSNQATAQTAATNTLSPAVNPTLATSGANALATVLNTKAPGLIMIPGAAANTSVQGEHLEPIPTGGTTAQPFQFGVPTALLANYFWDGQTTMTTRSIYLAQAVVTSGTGNGANGVFNEWSNHEKCFSMVNFPTSYSTTQGTASGGSYPAFNFKSPVGGQAAWAPASKTFSTPETNIYGWDTGGKGKGNTC